MSSSKQTPQDRFIACKYRGILSILQWSQGVILFFLVLLREHEPVGIIFLAVSEVASRFLTSCLSGNALDMNRLVVYYNCN